MLINAIIACMLHQRDLHRRCFNACKQQKW